MLTDYVNMEQMKNANTLLKQKNRLNLSCPSFDNFCAQLPFLFSLTFDSSFTLLNKMKYRNTPVKAPSSISTPS